MAIGPFGKESEAWAWAAGLFEGEGHITHRQYKRTHPAGGCWMRGLVLGMTDEDSVRLFHKIVGAGRIREYPPPKDKPHWSMQWRWECTLWTDTERILTRFLPMLGQRRAAAAKELLANPARYPNERLKTHCLRGHPLSGDNVYVWKGRRTCIACRQLRQQGYRERDRAAA